MDRRQCWMPGPFDSDESRSAYDRLVGEWLRNGRSLPERVSGTAPTVSMVVLALWRHAQAHYVKPDGTPTGEAAHYRDALRALRTLYGDTPAASFRPKALKVVRDRMSADREDPDRNTGPLVGRHGWSRTYANRQVKRVQQVFRWAASEELVPAAVATGLNSAEALRKGVARAEERLEDLHRRRRASPRSARTWRRTASAGYGGRDAGLSAARCERLRAAATVLGRVMYHATIRHKPGCRHNQLYIGSAR